MIVPHQVSLVFDDGFPASCRRVASIFESYQLRAVFAVLTQPERFKECCSEASGGGWPLYQELRDRGHLIHPHGSDHQNLSTLELSEAVDKIQSCLNDFQNNHFPTEHTVFHYPYNSGSEALNRLLLNHVKAVRVGVTGGAVWNTQKNLDERILCCTAYGPDFCDQHLLELLTQPIPTEAKRLVYNLHGIEGEGWGSIHEKALHQALDLIVASPHLSYSDLSDI